ncbi:hypothetical protein ACH4LN_32190 [Streptomyces albus]|uniref:hypothetical protein n=1 Tax=Streptomyces TaxID=1883 RepID=UPI000A49C258|nr:hypothetical protein TPA0909_07120 [Streptomyces albus]
MTVTSTLARGTPREASAAVRAVEVRMLAGMSEAEQASALRILQGMICSLRDGADAGQ